jgi:hypothetical protein
LLRDYALCLARKSPLKGYYIYGGNEESNPFNSRGQQYFAKNSEEVFDSELFFVLDLPISNSTAVQLYEEQDDLRPRAIIGVEVLRTCKRICEEGLDVLYGMNAFHFDTHMHLKYMQHCRKWMQPTK